MSDFLRGLHNTWNLEFVGQMAGLIAWVAIVLALIGAFATFMSREKR